MNEMLSMLSLEHMALEGRERDGLTGSLEILTSAFFLPQLCPKLR